ncbi:carbon starvation protein A [Butyrivibrio sp. JL13D10]|uniref:carbon starvation CstA family protein n=1 Tax=Butyrivibrio sp. JL13D10 TaxID=3236815 RepID=UPI0038B4F0DB
MISLFVSLLVLLLGYFFYGRLVERLFGPDDRKTPATLINDGVDCVPLSQPKAFLIQLLNIAGTGPIFGALMGACFGPVVFLWIVFGSILAGAVHDYLSGMISSRNQGASLPELTGKYLGRAARIIMHIFTILLMILCGAVMCTSPAALIATITPSFLNSQFWVVVILIYYIFATLLPIDQIIGKIYPIFGGVLIIMAISILGGILFGGYQIPNIHLENLHPDNLPIWPYMFITVACGAISGFHATQSPIIAKCITNENQGRRIFYGAMLTEATIALIWAAAGVAFYGSTQLLNNAITSLGQSGTVYEISTKMLGNIGGVLAIVGVVACPITTGDTAFRSARIMVSELTHLNQRKIKNRLLITFPLLVIGAILTQLDFNILWRYFSWANQTLAMITLWTCTSYLLKESDNKYKSLITALPATFMSAVSLTYILMAKEGLRLSATIGYPAGLIFAAILFIVYIWKLFKE